MEARVELFIAIAIAALTIAVAGGKIAACQVMKSDPFANCRTSAGQANSARFTPNFISVSR